MFSEVLNSFKSNDVLLSEVNNAAVLTLNRPQKLNSFNVEMMKELYGLVRDLEGCEKSVVVIKGSGRAFCAGMDLRSIGNFGAANCDESLLMDLIQNYKKPYAAIIDGITMGGACFFSMTAKYRIATERTIFAMPETAIGFYTNAGASYFLPKLKNNLGMYIALTGARIEGYDVKKIGLASHFIESKNIEYLIETLGGCKSDHEIDQAIEKFSATGPSKLDENIRSIDKCFRGKNVEEIFRNLKSDGSEWAVKSLATLNKMSPTSLKICHRQLSFGKDMTLRECLKMEHRMTSNIVLIHNKNLHEGIRAVIKDKDNNPKWIPARLEDVKDEDVQKVFEPLAEKFELKFNSIPSKL